MSELEDRLLLAQGSPEELERLLSDYLPFIRKQVGKMEHSSMEFDEGLSIALLLFVNCVKQYTQGRGGFLSFYQTALRNRLIDEKRRQKRHAGKIISLFQPDSEGREQVMDTQASIDYYRREDERRELALEIDSFNAQLEEYGLSFSQLARISPKQERSRAQCFRLARAVTQNETYLAVLTQQHRLPQTQLADEFGISPKTIEKHRKYIVVLSLLLIGEYPGIRAFLPIYKGVS